MWVVSRKENNWYVEVGSDRLSNTCLVKRISSWGLSEQLLFVNISI